MKKTLLLSLLITSSVWSQSEDLTLEFKSLVARHNLGKATDQAYCYQEAGSVEGYQPDKLQRIASVTKLFTTLLASETLDLNQKFLTRIYIGKDSLHIEGTRDPYFEEDKFLLLLKSLNNLGYTSFKRISFNEDFHFYDLALGTYEKITPEKTRARLNYYLSGKNPNGIRTTWNGVVKFAAEEGIDIEGGVPSVKVPSIIISNTNPLKDENPVLYIHESKPFHGILKSMNVMSKNYVAENVYLMSSKIKSFSTLMQEKGIAASTFRIYNGSGLPIESPNSRLDNLATCRIVLKIIEELSLSIGKHNLVLSDIMAVNGGKDLGSFRERFKEQPETHESVLSKTGTLKHTSSLAGVILIGKELPFAILNQTTNVSEARKMQDKFVSRMFHFLGEPTPLDYSKISIFPWDGSEFLKPAY